MMNYKPTLEEQLAVRKMTDEECIDTLVPSRGLAKWDFWLFRHFEFAWHLIHWDWFDPLGSVCI